jgi:hypothetical protein
MLTVNVLDYYGAWSLNEVTLSDVIAAPWSSAPRPVTPEEPGRSDLFLSLSKNL